MEKAMNGKILKLGTIRLVFYEKFSGFFRIMPPGVRARPYVPY